MFLFGKRRLICPYCLAENRAGKELTRCLNSKCGMDLPVQYVKEYDAHPPFFVQVFGWSQVGKTVFLDAVTLMLAKMSNVWPRYSYSAATDPSQHRVAYLNDERSMGHMPVPTPLGLQEAYIMLLRNMERWGGRTMVSRDCNGEIFDNLEVPVEQAPYLLNAPTTFMLISLPDLPYSRGRTIELLMNNYINTLMKHGVNFNKQRRKLVVVFTKGDKIHNLPVNLRNYLINDPLWAAVNARGQVEQLDAMKMQQYLERMGRVSEAIENWIQEEASGKAFVRLARGKNIDMRFSLISSTGADVGDNGAMPVALAPRRVLDPYFWALEFQSSQ